MSLARSLQAMIKSSGDLLSADVTFKAREFCAAAQYSPRNTHNLDDGILCQDEQVVAITGYVARWQDDDKLQLLDPRWKLTTTSRSVTIRAVILRDTFLVKKQHIE